MKEYSVRFNSLARFAPRIVSTPELGRDKSVHWLKPKIAQDVMIGAESPQTYSEALERALSAEIFVNKLTPAGPSQPSPAPQRERFESARNREVKNKKKF